LIFLAALSLTDYHLGPRVGGSLGRANTMPGTFGVDAVDRRPVGLGGDVQRLARLADQLALGGRLDRQLGQFLGRELSRDAAALDDVAVRDRLAADMDHTAARRPAGRRDVQQLSPGLDQGDPSGRAGLLAVPRG
jgi:hypothetical protein